MKKQILVIASLLFALTAWSQSQVEAPDTLSSDDVATFLAKNPQAHVATSATGNIVVKLHKEIFYDIRKSDNDRHSASTVLRQVGEFMKQFKDARVYASSYADRGTGNREVNKMYASRRAEKFRDDLIRQYKVDPNRVITESFGDAKQPFEVNDLNRCVIVHGFGYLSVPATGALTAQQMADANRARYQQDRDQRYAAERDRYSRVDTLVISHKDTLWVIEEPDTLREERPFRVNRGRGMNNWFLTLEGGPSIFQGDHNVDAVWKDRIFPGFNFSLGKWLCPAIAVRAAVDFDMVHSYFNPDPNDYKQMVHHAEVYDKRPWLHRMHYNAWNFHGDLMVNVTSFIWRPYNRRIWNLIPYVGLGCIVTWDNGNQDWFNYGLCWNFGVLNSFRINEHFDINVDIRVKKFPDKFNSFIQGHENEGITNAMIGLTWHFTKRGF